MGITINKNDKMLFVFIGTGPPIGHFPKENVVIVGQNQQQENRFEEPIQIIAQQTCKLVVVEKIIKEKERTDPKPTLSSGEEKNEYKHVELSGQNFKFCKVVTATLNTKK